MNALSVILLCLLATFTNALNGELISNFTVNLVKTQQAVILGCNEYDLLAAGRSLLRWNQPVLLLNLKNDFSLTNALTKHNHAKTSIILDCSCSICKRVLQISSDRRSFNKTYQWMLWDPNNIGLEKLIGDLKNVGPNAQITYVNKTLDEDVNYYSLFDVHSKGRHLNAPLEIIHYAEWQGSLITFHDIFTLQGIRSRDQFNKLQLRGATVIDKDNVTTNDQIKSILSNSAKQDGVAAFTRYHYDLSQILQERLNFSINFRNLRGWAGRLRGGSFRLGFLGAIKRNEADIGASAAFNRINRFEEFDTIHQSWKFDSAFMYRFTSDIDADSKKGNFLAPFSTQVWLVSGATILVIIIIWHFAAWIMRKNLSEGREDKNGFLLKTFAAICQQGLDMIPTSLPPRTIIFSLLLFSLVMYNYYTSSVVGGLLNSSEQGPKTVMEIINSPLKLSFEDIGYYKILFKTPPSSTVQKMYMTKVLPQRSSDDLPVFTHIKEAVPYLKKGGYAFHCERVDAYPEIARQFDANEICDLRIVSGLLAVGLMNWIVSKNSQYTEGFRVIMCLVRETGLVRRTLTIHQPERPQCQSSYTVYPVSLSGVLSAFIMLGVGMVAALITLAIEILVQNLSKKLNSKVI